VDFWNFRISRVTTVPGLNLWGFFIVLDTERGRFGILEAPLKAFPAAVDFPGAGDFPGADFPGADLPGAGDFPEEPPVSSPCFAAKARWFSGPVIPLPIHAIDDPTIKETTRTKANRRHLAAAGGGER